MKNSCVIQVLLLVVVSLFFESEARMISLEPRAFDSSNISYIQMKNIEFCSYSVLITTSCSSSKTTRDLIGLAFGDAYGNQVYVPRLDDPSTHTFEQCSTDSFQITGPCAQQICSVYLYRTGHDGWKPESVTISGDHSSEVSFYYDTFMPKDLWYGFDLCHSPPSSSSQMLYVSRWVSFLIMGFVFFALL